MTSVVNDYLILTKVRITALVLVTTAAGFLLASSARLDPALLAWTLLGTGLAASGAAALNQFLEREADARMRRTAGRPIPAGRMTPARGLTVGVALSVVGVAILVAFVNLLTGFLALATVLLYVGVYTPLKRMTPLNTIIGAIPGAIPPVMGWTAVTGEAGLPAWVLFAILFLWQLPHFLAIAWIFRDDYRLGGFPMLPVIDPDGEATGRQVALYCAALVPVSLIPTFLGLAGPIYFFGALVLGLAFLGAGLMMAVRRRGKEARRVLLASVTYLPLLLALLVADRAPI
ncbi:MAG TPA: heme o synthase [Gemmatimonadota bacterium]|nr:heme o synthase [Gemmatimonadota bacterium]